MEVRAFTNNIRISPRKVRIVVDLIRGKNCGEALAILAHTPKRPCAARWQMQKIIMI